MERNSTIHKIIFGVFDVLLVIGAIASVVTIDRGRWLFNNPAFYQPPPPAEARQYAPLSLDAQPRNVYEIIPQTGNPCPEKTPSPDVTMDASLNAVPAAPSGVDGLAVTEAPEVTADTLCEN